MSNLKTPIEPSDNHWTALGPFVLNAAAGNLLNQNTGRVTGIAFGLGPNKEKRMWGAAANGGAWYSDDYGDSWRAAMNADQFNPGNPGKLNADALACGAIAVCPSDQKTVIIGSGEGNRHFKDEDALAATGLSYFGVGPVRGTYTGAQINWTLEEAQPSLIGEAFFQLAWSPADKDFVMGATSKGLYKRQKSGSKFVWKHDNLSGLKTNASKEPRVSGVIVASDGSTTTFFAACWGGPVVYSDKNGDQWHKLKNDFPNTGARKPGRISLAVSPENPNVVYALAAAEDNTFLSVYRNERKKGVWAGWKDLNQGTNKLPDIFSYTNLPIHQGNYDQALVVNPNDVNVIYVAGIILYIYRCEINASTDTFKSCKQLSTARIRIPHADAHALAFEPKNFRSKQAINLQNLDASKLWYGDDGGLYLYAPGGARSKKPQDPSNPGQPDSWFVPKNTGMNIFLSEKIGQHPKKDAVFYAGAQDMSGQKYVGEPAWIVSPEGQASGDTGAVIVNWQKPGNVVWEHSGGFHTDSSMPFEERYDYFLKYPPLIGTPFKPKDPDAESMAKILATGGSDPLWRCGLYLSDDFGANYHPLFIIPAPNSKKNHPYRGARPRSLCFADDTRLYAGTMDGRIFYLTDIKKSGGGYSCSHSQLPAIPNGKVPITSIAIDPADATGKSIYVTLGGSTTAGRVQYYDGTKWESRSGNAGNHTNLLNINHNVIAISPKKDLLTKKFPIYVGTDVGVWYSTDEGANWRPFAKGMPEVAVVDLKIYPLIGPNGRLNSDLTENSPYWDAFNYPLLRAATYGRGIYERSLNPKYKNKGSKLYVRTNLLDRGLYNLDTNDLWNKAKKYTGDQEAAQYADSPDIKFLVSKKSDFSDIHTGTFTESGHLKTIYANGKFQLDFSEFAFLKSDAKLPAANEYVAVLAQIHNRGTTWPAKTTAYLLGRRIKNSKLKGFISPEYFNSVVSASAGDALLLPDNDWRLLGVSHLNTSNVQTGASTIFGFNITNSLKKMKNYGHPLCLLLLISDGTNNFVQTDLRVLVQNHREAALGLAGATLNPSNNKVIIRSSSK